MRPSFSIANDVRAFKKGAYSSSRKSYQLKLSQKPLLVGSDRCGLKCARIVAGKRTHVPRHRASHLADRRIYLCGLTANIVCVILDQAVDLPRWHPNLPQREREVFRRNVDEFDLASDRSSNRVRDFPVRYGCRSCNRIRLANVAWLRQHDRSNQCNVTDVDRADACVANRREEPPLIRDPALSARRP
jgi:hypothetical protein